MVLRFRRVILWVMWLVFPLAGAHAQACECLDEPTEVLEERAELIIVGQITDARGIVDARQELTVKVSILEVLKGAHGPSVLEFRTPASAEKCGLPVQEGKEWVLYLRKVRMGEWYSDKCDGSKAGEMVNWDRVEDFAQRQEKKGQYARYLLEDYVFVEDLVVRGEGTIAKLFRPNETHRQKGLPFGDATLMQGELHHNGYPIHLAVMYRCDDFDRVKLEKYAQALAGYQDMKVETKWRVDDAEMAEILIKPAGSEGSRGAMIAYFKEEKIVVVYFLE